MTKNDDNRAGRKANERTDSETLKNSAHSAGNRRTVSELARHIAELGREVEHLKKAARREIEGHWAVHHTDLYPRFLRWKETLGIEIFSVFSVRGRVLDAEPLLSSPQSPTYESPVTLGLGSQSALNSWGESAEECIAYALASRDCQVDFKSGFLCVPVVLFDNPRGVILARAPTFTTQSYGTIMAETAKLLCHVREIALDGESSRVKNSGAAAS
jgi:hypothetical protein